jgi:signal recognition particle subunit SEC65
MTQQEILDYNKRCTEFLGFKCSVNEQYELPKMMTFPPKNNSNLCHTAKICCINDMQFHSDWNWIMEVVEAIEKLGYESLTGGSEYYYPEKGMRYIQSFIKEDINIYQEAKTKKETVVQAINQFLIWYNENN